MQPSILRAGKYLKLNSNIHPEDTEPFGALKSWENLFFKVVLAEKNKLSISLIKYKDELSFTFMAQG